MREKLLIANWKMNFSVIESSKKSRQLEVLFEDKLQNRMQNKKNKSDVKIIICPNYLSLKSVHDILGGKLYLGVQSITHLSESEGAFTGEISGALVREFAEFAIIGHSERRNMLMETNSEISEKLLFCSKNNIRPILCLGENQETRSNDSHLTYVINQLRNSVSDFKEWGSLIVAYEPVWAIGTGVACEPEDAVQMIRTIRRELKIISGSDLIPVLYGGSVSSSNIGVLIDSGDIDGALIGTSSMNPLEFHEIINICTKMWEK